MASTTLMRLLVELGVDSTDFMEEMNKAESKAHSTGKGIMKGIGGSLAGIASAAGVALTAVSAAVASTIAPASNLAETMSKVGVVFEDNADIVLAWGKKSASAMGMSSQQAMEAAGTYGNLFRAMGITTDISTDMSMSLVQLASDLASFNNANPEEVLAALRSGLSGETEPLKRLGVNLNQALIEQKALEMGLWSGVGALDVSAKAQATYALILEQTTLAQGDFARTSEGLANQQRILAANFENIKATIGGYLLPVVNETVGGFNDMLATVQSLIGVSAPLEMKMQAIGKVLANYLNDLVAQVPNILQAGISIVVEIVKGIVSALPALMPAIVALLLTLVDGIVTLMPIILDAGLKIIVGLATGLAVAFPTLIPAIVKMLLDLVGVFVANIGLIVSAGIQLIFGIIQGLMDALPILIEQAPIIIMDLVNAIIENLPMLITAALQLILTLAAGLIQSLPELIMMIPQIVLAIVQALIAAAPQLVTATAAMIKTMITDFKARTPQLFGAGQGLMQGFWNGLKSMFAKIWSDVRNFVSQIIKTIKDALKMKSPSLVMQDLGKNTMLGFAEGLEKYMTLPSNIILEATGEVTGSVSPPGMVPNEYILGNSKYPTAREIGQEVAYQLQRLGAVG